MHCTVHWLGHGRFQDAGQNHVGQRETRDPQSSMIYEDKASPGKRQQPSTEKNGVAVWPNM